MSYLVDSHDVESQSVLTLWDGRVIDMRVGSRMDDLNLMLASGCGGQMSSEGAMMQSNFTLGGCVAVGLRWISRVKSVAWSWLTRGSLGCV